MPKFPKTSPQPQLKVVMVFPYIGRHIVVKKQKNSSKLESADKKKKIRFFQKIYFLRLKLPPDFDLMAQLT